MGQTWVKTETAGCDLGDVRLNRRLEAMLQALGERPGESLPTAFQDWSNTKAAYRFFSNGNMSECLPFCAACRRSWCRTT
jgi:hypothetical protein